MTNQDDLSLPSVRGVSARAEEISIRDFKLEVLLNPILDDAPPLKAETQSIGSSTQRKLRNCQPQNLIAANSHSVSVARATVAYKESNSPSGSKGDADPSLFASRVASRKLQVNFE